jgi:uncharacterized alpha-E superfamily protein
MLLSRVADSLYWGARYLERAEDTARIVRSYTEMVIDLPTSALSTWEPLLAVAGSSVLFEQQHEGQKVGVGELPIVRYLVADQQNPGSISSSVESGRENLRTTREIIPREAWQTVNDLYLYAGSNAAGGVERRGRARFLGHLIGECQQLDGVMTTVMNRDEAYELWRLGQSLERADMTTRVVGVRAATLLAAEREKADDHSIADIHDDVQWMGLLRSVSALQMYQRATRGPIEGAAAVRFLLLDPTFPRSVASCAIRIREALSRLPRSRRTLPVMDELERVLAVSASADDDGASLDAAMEDVQAALAAINDVVHEAFVRSSV